MSKKDREIEELETQEALENLEPAESPEDAPKSRRKRVMTSLLNNEGEANVTNFKDLIKSIDLNGEWFRHNLFFICLVTVSLLIFVTNRYQAQQEQIEEDNLKRELAEMRYKWLTRFSELTSSTRQSQIEKQLIQNGDTELKHSKKPPFIIRTRK